MAGDVEEGEDTGRTLGAHNDAEFALRLAPVSAHRHHHILAHLHTKGTQCNGG